MHDWKTDGRRKTAVMGAGNILMSDDGIGVRAVETLKELGGLPDDIDLIDAGTATLDALPLLDGVERLIIVDAVKGGGPPGTIYQFSPEDISEIRSGKISLHQISLLEALASNSLLGSTPPEIVIVGVEPQDISSGTDLSPKIAGALPKVIEAVFALLRS